MVPLRVTSLDDATAHCHCIRYVRGVYIRIMNMCVCQRDNMHVPPLALAVGGGGVGGGSGDGECDDDNDTFTSSSHLTERH